jgi:hypothetical protein
LDALQLVTWNDYEEGTEIESGIDNCVSVSAAISGSQLSWKLSGKENTVDHYKVYVTQDGDNLMLLSEMSVGENSLNLCSYSLVPASYQFFVQAIGKPSLRNQLSGPAPYTPQCPGNTGDPQAFQLHATPASLKIASGHVAEAVVSLTSGTWDSPITLSCADPPAEIQCKFSPPTLKPAGRQSKPSAKLSISFAPSVSGLHERRGQGPLYASWFAVAFGAFLTLSPIQRMGLRRALRLAVLVGATILFSACGNGAPSHLAGGQDYVLSVIATSGGKQVSTQITLQIQ